MFKGALKKQSQYKVNKILKHFYCWMKKYTNLETSISFSVVQFYIANYFLWQQTVP